MFKCQFTLLGMTITNLLTEETLKINLCPSSEHKMILSMLKAIRLSRLHSYKNI